MTATRYMAGTANPSPRPARGPFFLEKWYVDTLLPDGSVLLVYLGRMRLLGFPIARVTAQLFRPDGTSVGGDRPAHAISSDEHGVTFGPTRLDGEWLRFETPGLRGALHFERRGPPVVLRDPFLALGGQRIDWHIELPDADVTGFVEWPRGRQQIEGRGYRDHVWFDIAPWRFPIRRLKWGRAYAGSHAATWVEAEAGTERVAARWEDGRVTLDDGTPPALGPARTLVETAVVDLEGLRLGPLRPLLRSITGDPRETKWTAEARIGNEDGRAIHEVVRWR